MYDYGLSVLEQYELTAKTTYRGRGAIICDTQDGLKIIREYRGSQKKLELLKTLQDQIHEAGIMKVDYIRENREGSVISTDRDKIPYVVRDWYMGRECDTKSKADILDSASLLARLHKVMRMPLQENYLKESLVDECQRHNRELRKIAKFIQKKQKRNSFENMLANSMKDFIRHGEMALSALEHSQYVNLREQSMKEGCICHGEYNQHNILWVDSEPIVVNADKWNFDTQITDLYQFMRKIMEKHNWDVKLGQMMIECYHKEKPLTKAELINLQIRLAYPWKFWKLVNYYANNNKVWISGKNTEKLEKLNKQKESWQFFVKNCFSDSFFRQFGL